jgi:hypothetical protein
LRNLRQAIAAELSTVTGACHELRTPPDRNRTAARLHHRRLPAQDWLGDRADGQCGAGAVDAAAPAQPAAPLYTLATRRALQAILEALRAPLCDVQDDAAKKYAAKPLPLAPHEQAALGTSLNVWMELALGYLRCFDESCGSVSASPEQLQKLREHCQADSKQAAQAALMAQRTIAVFADWQLDLARGSQVPDAMYWQKLHQILRGDGNPRHRQPPGA